eukprot:scaffold3210_cov4495-Pavlova_lutheri.AAC.9
MPIGVPKVAYRLPGEPTPQWVDIYNRLYRERVLFVGQDLDDELSNQLVGIMLYLNAEDETKGGDLGKRIALPHSRIMIHQPEGGTRGQASEVLYEAQEVLRIRRQVGQIYAERTGQSLSVIARDMDRDRFLSAKEAKEYGIVDQVALD